MKFTRDTGVNAVADTVLQAVLDVDHDLSRAFSGLNAISRSAAGYADSSEQASPNGLCDLGSDAKVPASRLPTLDSTKLPAGTVAPVGTIVLWPSETPPTGWIACAGTGYEMDAMPDLFAVLGYNFGGSEENGYFGTPDLRGMFVRGWDHGAAIDPDAASRYRRNDETYGDRVGTTQESANLSHGHAVTASLGRAAKGSAWFWPFGEDLFYSTISDEGGSNTRPDGRPDNIALMWIMKAVA